MRKSSTKRDALLYRLGILLFLVSWLLVMQAFAQLVQPALIPSEVIGVVKRCTNSKEDLVQLYGGTLAFRKETKTAVEITPLPAGDIGSNTSC